MGVELMIRIPGTPTSMSLDPALRSRIESILNANRVVLFMKGQPSMPQCGFSAKAVGALQDPRRRVRPRQRAGRPGNP
jgi:monothiol glutaredoxin